MKHREPENKAVSEYTVSLDWSKVKPTMMVELRHDKYPAVAGKVGSIHQYDRHHVGVWVEGAWRNELDGWTLWVKPDPDPDPLVELLSQIAHLSALGQADRIRAAGYRTEAEWEAKSGTQPEFTPLVCEWCGSVATGTAARWGGDYRIWSCGVHGVDYIAKGSGWNKP